MGEYAHKTIIDSTLAQALPRANICVHPSMETSRFKIYRVQYNGCTPQQIFSAEAMISKALQVSVSVRFYEYQGQPHVHLEIPKRNPEAITWAPTTSKLNLPVDLGLSVMDEPVVFSLSDAPHGIIGGNPGSGKSNALNALICNWLSIYSPDELQLLLIDPKMVELIFYDEVPHLLAPIITDVKVAAKALKALCKTMDERYALLKSQRCKNIFEYNERKSAKAQKLPFIVLVVDELANLLVAGDGLKKYGKAIEGYLSMLGAKARAVGINLVLATQSFKAEVIKTSITSNTPLRVSFAVLKHHDSSAILGCTGAETLLGKGDGLVSFGGNQPIRFQAPLITNEQVEQVTASAIQRYGKADFDFGSQSARKDFNFIEGSDADAVTNTLRSDNSSVMVLRPIGQGGEHSQGLTIPLESDVSGGDVANGMLKDQGAFGYETEDIWTHPELTNLAIQKILNPKGFITKNAIRNNVINTESKAVRIIDEMQDNGLIERTYTPGKGFKQKKYDVALSPQVSQLGRTHAA